MRLKLGLRDGLVVIAAPEHDDGLAVAKEAGSPLRQVLSVAQAEAQKLLHRD